MERSYIRVHFVEIILIFWIWWWSVCLWSPLEFSKYFFPN